MACFDLPRPLRVDQRGRPPRFCQQDAAFLKRLADRRDPETEPLAVEPLAAGIEFRLARDVVIAGIDAAAGKHQRA